MGKKKIPKDNTTTIKSTAKKSNGFVMKLVSTHQCTEITRKF